MYRMLMLYYIENSIFPVQKSAAVVQFSPKAKNKEPVIDVWRYMTVADVANAIGKSVGKYHNIYFYLCSFILVYLAHSFRLLNTS
jgi:membrane protein YqaA with SNARE-associated domain